MKVWINVIAVLAFVGTLVAGKLYWDERTSAESIATPTPVTQASSTSPQKNWASYTGNLSKEVVEKLKVASETGNPIKIVMVGSQDTSKENNAWPALVEKELMNKYGSDLITVEVQEYDQDTTLQFVKNQSYEKIIAAQPDVLIFEPFLANDNGVVGITNTLDNLSVIMTRVESQVDDLVTIIQPSHPIYNAINYPKEAEQLKAFADESGYEYINHWEKWPKATSEELLTYLTEEKDAPSMKGNKAWAEAVIEYWINEK
ncbi:SGNH/GDSL hydrolase family protein [Priestia flexa]|uniref:epsX protein n=1 Tax=Priestia flexa TaxID=86664 RepID=UPI000C232172|nr:epsX protein [Priestia flexa]MEC0667006.1 SGNH/GDSL hydrolase family protein [Priestia flexa]